MRVTLDDKGDVWFGDKCVGVIDDLNMSISDYEKLQAYIAAANEAFDAMQAYCNRLDRGNFPALLYYEKFADILQKVGD